tara:strand:- start:300 stop:617 length:318 start_codon:yes stop_codon:yes gene_type:complete
MFIMPLYPVKNLKTGETKDLHMLVEDYEKWRVENSDWDKDWSQGCAGLRTLSKEYYSSDAIASQGAYQDKNNSLSSSVGGEDYGRNRGNEVTADNSQIKEKYGIK